MDVLGGCLHPVQSVVVVDRRECLLESHRTAVISVHSTCCLFCVVLLRRVPLVTTSCVWVCLVSGTCAPRVLLEWFSVRAGDERRVGLNAQ
jgi:hypothetical protein